MKHIFCSITIICVYCISCHTPVVKHSEPETKALEAVQQAEFTFIKGKDSIAASGEQIIYHKNGVIEMRGFLKNNMREGVWRSWYENGLPWSETEFKGGIKNGRTSTWYENGKKRYEGFFTNDKETGSWTFWDENGVVVAEKDLVLSSTKNHPKEKLLK